MMNTTTTFSFSRMLSHDVYLIPLAAINQSWTLS